MKQKKRDNAFTIWFNPDIPRHALAMDALNALGRKKADFLSRLIEAAAKNPEAFQMILPTASHEKEPMANARAENLTELYRGSLSSRGQESRHAAQAMNTEELRTISYTGEPRNELSDVSPIVKEPKEVYSEEDDTDLLPQDMQESFMANLQYFEELGGEDDEDDD